MRRNAQHRTETRSIQRNVQVLLTVSGIVFLLAGLVLAASGASVSGAVGSVSERLTDSEQPTDDGDAPSDDSAAGADGDGEPDETGDEDGEAEGGDESDGETDTGDGSGTDTDNGDETDGTGDETDDTGDDSHTLTTVVENRSGEPIDTATVTVDTGSASSVRKSVDGGGEAEFTLEDGEYAVTADADGYRPANETVGIDGGDETRTLTLEQRNATDDTDSSDDTNDSDGSDDGDSTDSDDGLHALTVTVEDENGSAIDDATVELEEESGLLTAGETTTKDADDDGEVEFTELEDGEYTVTASADDFEERTRDVEIDGSDDEIALTLASTDG